MLYNDLSDVNVGNIIEVYNRWEFLDTMKNCVGTNWKVPYTFLFYSLKRKLQKIVVKLLKTDLEARSF